MLSSLCLSSIMIVFIAVMILRIFAPQIRNTAVACRQGSIVLLEGSLNWFLSYRLEKSWVGWVMLWVTWYDLTWLIENNWVSVNLLDLSEMSIRSNFQNLCASMCGQGSPHGLSTPSKQLLPSRKASHCERNDKDWKIWNFHWNILKHCRLRFQKISDTRFHDISWASVWSTRSSRLLASSTGDLLRKRSPRGGARDGTRWHEGNENTTEHDRTRIHRQMMTQWWHVANNDLIKINQVCMLKFLGKDEKGRLLTVAARGISNSLRNAGELTSTFSAASFAQKAPVWPAWDGLMAWWPETSVLMICSWYLWNLYEIYMKSIWIMNLWWANCGWAEYGSSMILNQAIWSLFHRKTGKGRIWISDNVGGMRYNDALCCMVRSR